MFSDQVRKGRRKEGRIDRREQERKGKLTEETKKKEEQIKCKWKERREGGRKDRRLREREGKKTEKTEK